MYSLASPELLDQLGMPRGRLFVAQPKQRSERVAVFYVRHTCFASTACVNSGEKATCVIDTSSRTILKRLARIVKFSLTRRDT